MDFVKKSGDKNIIDFGSIILFDQNSEYRLEIKCDEKFSFTLIFTFQDGGTKQDVKWAVNGNSITCVCENFNNPIGMGVVSPTELATFKGKKIYINFWVISLGDSGSKHIDYTLYMDN